METISIKNIYAYSLFKNFKYVIAFECSMTDYDYCAIDHANTLIKAMFILFKKYRNDNLDYIILKNF